MGVHAVLGVHAVHPDFAARCDDVLAADGHILVVRVTYFGTGRDSGGRSENHLRLVCRFGLDGRWTHAEVFEAEQADQALTCFDELRNSTTADHCCAWSFRGKASSGNFASFSTCRTPTRPRPCSRRAASVWRSSA